MVFDSIASGIEKGYRNLTELLGAPVHHYCRLETADSSSPNQESELDCLVADDGSLITVLRFQGSLCHVGEENYHDITDGLSEKLASAFTKPGHNIQVVFESDPEAAAEKVHNLLQPSVITAKNLGLNVEGIYKDWEEALSRYCTVEQCFLVLWTRPSVMPKSMATKALKNRAASIKTVPHVHGTQQVCKAFDEIKDTHAGFVQSVHDAFRGLDLYMYKLNAYNALNTIRRNIDPEFTSKNWKPLLPGDPLPIREPEPDTPSRELLQNCLYPALPRQVFPREGEVISKQIVRIGDRVYTPIALSLFPLTPKPFQELFRSLSRREDKLPWRASFLLSPGARGLLNIKSILTSIIAFASSNNKKFNRAIEELNQMALEGITLTKIQVAFCTWARITESEEKAVQLLRRRSAEMAKAIQGWGTCDVQEVIGDPLLGTTATVPAMMPVSPGASALSPMEEAIGLFPIFRPASPWETGSFVLRTQDGKIIPFTPNSSKQTSWVDLGVAPMGGGKSVFLNAFNFAFVFQAGLSRLPWLSIIDVGPSSSGLINLVKESLPDDKKYLASYHRLRMAPEYSVNPFDTPLGVRKPLPAHKTFLHNLLTLLSTPLNECAPKDGVPGLLLAAINATYDRLSDEEQPKLYVPSICPEIDQKLKELDYEVNKAGLKIDEHTKWWEVVDFFFALDMPHEAAIAQRYAVPLLDDIASEISKNEGLRIAYEEYISDVWRSFNEAVAQFVILKEPTQFEIGDSQIVSLDLDEVAPRGGAQADRQAAVMYMLARHLLGSRFFLMPSDVANIPTNYKAYHAKRIEEIREDPKRLCYDEAHRVTQNQAVSGQMVADIQTMTRESRKWNLSLGLYTQSIEDFPDILLELATSVLLLGSGTKASNGNLIKKFGLNGACGYALERLGKPGRAGANFVGLFKTGEGVSQLILTLTVGAQALWSFSTTTEDVTIRNALYSKLGVTRTLQVLASVYPGGSAKEDVERRKRQVTDDSDADEEIFNVIKGITEELYVKAMENIK